MSPPRRILILKLGALGDVVRTTPLLRRLEGRVTWVTEPGAAALLRGHPRVKVVPIEKAGELRGASFDLVVSFDEDPRCCAVASSVKTSRLVGASLRDGERVYCAASSPWFDMSLISRRGLAAADRLKARGRRSYQELLFEACGLRFSGEECWLPVAPRRAPRRKVALEARVGPVWPGKAWPHFPELARRLREEGFEAVTLRQRPSLRRYLEDINDCGVLVCGDTLAMHAGLALRKSVVALFNCTSPHEIHGYGRLTKLVNPRLKDFFYSRRVLPAAAALPPARVWSALRAAMSS